MVNYLADGIGGSLGDSLATSAALITVSTVWYVSSVSGDDAITNGRDRARPFATLSYALSQAADNDIVVFLQDHAETLVATLTLNKTLVFIGEGSVGGVPTVAFTGDVSGNSAIIIITAARVEFRNLRFPPLLQANTGAAFNWTGVDGRMKGCHFESGQYDNGPKFAIGGDRFDAESCTWISVATSIATRPAQAILSTNSTFTLCRMQGCVISGGAYGWSSADTAFYFQSVSGHLRCENLSLLLGSDMKLVATATGFINVSTATGGSHVRWG